VTSKWSATGPPQLVAAAPRRFARWAHSSLLTITHTDALAMAQVAILGD
jgi:hypothetical protein